MRALLSIVAGGFLAFMLLAVADEWTFFRAAWLGDDEPAPSVADESLTGALDAVRGSLALTRHLYTSGGDSRFAERMPASESVLREILDDVSYLHRNGRVQDPLLRSFEVRDLRATGERQVEITTRELWEVRTRRLDDGTAADPPRITVVQALYRVRRTPSGWRVESWDWLPEGPEPAPSGAES